MLKIQTSEKPRPALRAVALFCALTVWILGLLAANPQLHATVHADADQSDHSCAVTLFSHGCADGPGTIVLDCSPVLFVAREHTVQPTPAITDVHDRLPPGRGPPLS